MSELSEQVTRKFTDVIALDDEWEISTDTGWEPLTHINQTVEYEIWRLELLGGRWLECADNHIVYLETGEQIYVKDLYCGDLIITNNGLDTVIGVSATGKFEQMYDVTVDSDNHRFFSNGILSHNTTVAAGYLLWYAMFVPDSTILIAAHKATGSNEIMQRVRYAYENIPDHIRAGAVEYNKGSLTFDNGSRVVATTTTENTGRGMSLSLVYLDEFAFVRNTIASEFWTSLSPTLATGGKCIVTSTPNSDDDTFANIWRGALNIFDEFGNERADGIGSNGFKGYLAKWHQHPDRDEAWADQERASIGEERFLREHECLYGDAKIKIRNTATGEIREITIEELYAQLVTLKVESQEGLVKNNKYEIWTDSGWSDFEGVMLKGTRETIKIELDNGATLETTPDHKMYTEAMIPVETANLTVGSNIITHDGTSKVIQISTSEAQPVYDIHNVINNNRFYANDMLVSNCEFVIYEETLINALKLADLEGSDPDRMMGQVRWYKHPHPDRSYVVSLDPSAGTGGDPAGIQVIELPTMEQVAEWQHNKTPIEGQMKCLMSILQYLKEMSVANIYWSVENNTIGEAALVVIRDTGEESFPGEFISEPKKVSGQRGRRGFHTSHKTKLEACISLKRLIETDRIRLRSKPLIKELKNFVAKGNSFAAKPGEHDDLVMALVLAIRMINYIATFEDDVYDAVNSNLVNVLDDDPDDWDAPLPSFF